MLILDPLSSRDLVKDIPPISLVIMGAPGSLFLNREGIHHDGTHRLTKLDPSRVSMGSAYTFEKFGI